MVCGQPSNWGRQNSRQNSCTIWSYKFWITQSSEWQTASRHVTSFPTCERIRCVAPDSFIIVAVRVSTVVASVVNAFIRKFVISVVGMFVWRLWRPGLTLFTAHCYRCAADVLTSVRWRIAVSTCTPYIQSTMLLYNSKKLNSLKHSVRNLIARLKLLKPIFDLVIH